MENIELFDQSMKYVQGFTTTEVWALIIGFLVIFAWLIACTIFLINLLRKFTYMQESNPHLKETMGLPRGTMRGFLTLTLLIVVVVLVCMSLVIDDFRGHFESLIGAFELMLAFYFGSKVMHHVTNSDKRKTEVKAQAEKEKSISESALKYGTANPVKADFEAPGAMG